jgi:hypothetical protein
VGCRLRLGKGKGASLGRLVVQVVPEQGRRLGSLQLEGKAAELRVENMRKVVSRCVATMSRITLVFGCSIREWVGLMLVAVRGASEGGLESGVSREACAGCRRTYYGEVEWELWGEKLCWCPTCK